jgi:DNA-directed RNA polymerase specialized sigma24 family protein
MPSSDVTSLLVAWNKGDSGANSRLMAAVYDDLRRVARRRLAAERADHSLAPTALVHETYLRLIDLRLVAGRSARAPGCSAGFTSGPSA